MKIPNDSRWTVLKYLYTSSNGHKYYSCKCACGTVKAVNIYAITAGTSKSCGCLALEQFLNRITSHEKSKTLTYKVWHAMLQRCTDPKQDNYHLYGGRGISFDPRWRKFENFLADMGERPTDEHSIERRDNNGDYTKDNCYWATRYEQSRNRRNNVSITFKGKTMILKDWAEELGLPYKALHLRIRRRGWSIEKAFTTPLLS